MEKMVLPFIGKRRGHTIEKNGFFYDSRKAKDTNDNPAAEGGMVSHLQALINNLAGISPLPLPVRKTGCKIFRFAV